MNREQLIIIALILVVLYMMNSSSSKDTVQAMRPMMGPMGRIRYNRDVPCSDGSPPPCITPQGHIRTREGYEMDPSLTADGFLPGRIRLGDKDYGKGHFIRNHIRHNNRNNMFSGMMGACDGGETKPMNIRREGFVACDKEPMNIRREGFGIDCIMTPELC